MMSEDKEYPLFPELPEAGKQEAQKLIDEFKLQLLKAADEAIGKLHCNIVPHIESDSWTNYRTQLIDGFRDYGNLMVQGEADFALIRAQIFKEFREEIIADLNQDLVEENERLKRQIKRMEETRRII